MMGLVTRRVRAPLNNMIRGGPAASHAGVGQRMYTRLASSKAFGGSFGVGAAAVAAGAAAGTLLSTKRPCSNTARCDTTASSSTTSADKIKVALCQLEVGSDKQQNIKKAKQAIEDAADKGAELICLPECWNCPYGNSFFPEYAEEVPNSGASAASSTSPSSMMLLEVARAKGVYICGGTIPERQGTKIYNTCICVGPTGQVLGKHRKVHLFDIDIPGKITFRESDTLTAGDQATVFDTKWGKIGVGVCYDIRFPELSMLMRERGCKVLLYPGAFNTTTGPKHWELLQRGRAVDTQSFVCTISPSRLPGFSYQAWGHSTVVSPWGEVLATTGHEPATVHAELNLAQVEEFRSGVPISKQKRHDMYRLEQPSKTPGPVACFAIGLSVGAAGVAALLKSRL